MPISRRTFNKAALASLLIPNASQAILPWLLRFLFSGFARRSLVRGLTSAARSRSVQASGFAGISATTSRRILARESTRRVAAPTAASRHAKRIQRLKNANSPTLRQEILTEIGIQLGFELITPESYGLEIPGVLGMAPIRAEEMVAHNAETIWISDETNQVIVEGKNLLSEPAVDKLVLELWDSTTGELLHSNEGDMPAIVNVDADGGFLSEPFKYRMVPVGPKNFQVYMPDAEAIAFRQTSPNIVVAHPHEVLTG